MKIGCCKHYNGDYPNETCDAGVRYADVTPSPGLPGGAYRRPCMVVNSFHGLKTLEKYGPQGTCDKYEEPSAEEIAKSEAAVQAAIERMKMTIPLIARIKKEHDGESWRGTDKCPICGNTLHLSHAAVNGHVWGKCETEGCLAWME